MHKGNNLCCALLSHPDTVVSEYPVKLVGGSKPSEGRVEVEFNGEWGTVCGDSWGIQDGNVQNKKINYDAPKFVNSIIMLNLAPLSRLSAVNLATFERIVQPRNQSLVKGPDQFGWTTSCAMDKRIFWIVAISVGGVNTTANMTMMLEWSARVQT